MLVVPVWEVRKGERVSQLTVFHKLTTLHHPYHLQCQQYLLLLQIIIVKIQYLVLGSVARTVSFTYLVIVPMASGKSGGIFRDKHPKCV